MKRKRESKKHWRYVKSFPAVRLALRLYELDAGQKVNIRAFIGWCVFRDALARLDGWEGHPGRGAQFGMESDADGSHRTFLDALWRCDAAAVAQAAGVYTAPRRSEEGAP